MKGLLILIVLGGAGLWAMYQFGGFATMDPAAQAQDIRENVKPGMTWEQVADLHEPRRVYPIDYSTRNGERQPINFDRKRMADMVANQQLGSGFKYKYEFSSSDAIEVIFDSRGKVQHVQDMMTTHDLLTGQNWKN